MLLLATSHSLAINFIYRICVSTMETTNSISLEFYIFFIIVKSMDAWWVLTELFFVYWIYNGLHIEFFFYRTSCHIHMLMWIEVYSFRLLIVTFSIIIKLSSIWRIRWTVIITNIFIKIWFLNLLHFWFDFSINVFLARSIAMT